MCHALKACPFCGAPAVFSEGNDGYATISCLQCAAMMETGVFTNGRHLSPSDMEKWAAVWNARVGADAAAKMNIGTP